MKNLFLAAAAVFTIALASCSQSTAPMSSTNGSHPMAASQNSKQLSVPINLTIIDTCCNDTVSITGTLHEIIDTNASGNITHLHANSSGLTGTGTSGNTYHGSITANEHIDTTNGASVTNAVEQLTMTASGGCKFKLILREHITTNADGTVVVDRMDFSTECF
ncbi:MAG TPA: hypothetical protein VEW28_10120 [Candidatus Kapabacteria bacterium]|nr:hypothetical protein [Candidatus Kapabacteria bacterium]